MLIEFEAAIPAKWSDIGTVNSAVVETPLLVLATTWMLFQLPGPLTKPFTFVVPVGHPVLGPDDTVESEMGVLSAPVAGLKVNVPTSVAAAAGVTTVTPLV